MEKQATKNTEDYKKVSIIERIAYGIFLFGSIVATIVIMYMENF